MGAMIKDNWKEAKEQYADLVRVEPVLFSEAVLQRADRILGGGEVAQEVVREMVEQVSYLTKDQVVGFLREGVTDGTFLYHRDRNIFEGQRAIVIPNTYFHINASSFLRAAAHLIPGHILAGKPYVSRESGLRGLLECDDDYEVNFASGCIGDLAIFQAGCVFSDPKNEKVLSPDEPLHNVPLGLHQLFGIAVANGKNFKSDDPSHYAKDLGGHGINTGYLGDMPNRESIPRIVSSAATVEMRSANFPVKLDTFLALPYTVWISKEIKEKKQEAADLYNSGNATNSGCVMPLSTLREFTNLYIAERQLESSILYALHQFAREKK